MRLVWSQRANTDRREIRTYIARANPAAALALDSHFSEVAAMLFNRPQMGRLGRIAGTRELVAHRNYILVYEIVGDQVYVLRLLHVARQFPSTT